jgi:HAD superfamily hydrolase (TIGR01509 family)
MSLSALIFDVDGTLADTEETHRQAFNYAFLRFELGWEWARALYRELLKTSGGQERIARYIGTLGVSPTEESRLLQLVPALHREKTRLYTELIADGRCPLRPGIVRLLDEASAAGIRLAIASTSALANTHALLTRHLGAGAPRMFSAITCADHVKQKKPAPDIYMQALAMLGEPAANCVALEDSVNGLRSAKAAGLYTLVTPSSWTLGDDFANADLELPHLGDANHALPPDSVAIVGGSWLGLAQLQKLRAATAAAEGAES